MGDQQIPTNLLDLARYERRKRDCEKAERRLSLEEARAAWRGAVLGDAPTKGEETTR